MSGDMGETNPQALTQGAVGPSPHALRARTKKPVIFGKYELLSRFRVGGMAEVWTARRLGGAEQSLVALKRILPSFTDEADYLAMFRDEARLVQQLAHPCIVATYEVGQVDDHPYIALEHVRGQNVAALIRRAREQAEPVPTAMALRIAIDVCSALEHAHSLTDASGNPLDIVHRDVSPTNILLGYDGAVKLIDFGIAKSNEQLMRTQAGLLKGKHGYLSPEQAVGEVVDARSDLFSLAICVWEMLAAKRLFLGASDFSSIERVREAVVPPLEGAGGPSAVELVLQRALSRDRDARHASATELREAFEQASEEGVAIATSAELATYLNGVFADEIALEASDEALEAPAPYEGTGLLDAFDDLEPVSTVSTLAIMPDAPDEPLASADDVEDDIDEDLDMTEVTSQSTADGERLEMVREPEADTEIDDAFDEPDTETDLNALPSFAAANDATEEATEPAVGESSDDPSEQPSDEAGVQAAAEQPEAVAEQPLADHSTPVALAAPAEPAADADEEQPDEPTRVVAYRSIESGEVGATASAESSDASPQAEVATAVAATLPGMGGVEWDDEELSTHLYDGPSATIVDHRRPSSGADAGTDEAGEGQSARPSVPPFGARPSVAPFSSRPGAPQFVLRPSTGSVPPGPMVAPAPTTHRPPAKATPAWLLPALVVASAVVAFIALSLFRSATPGTLHLTTEPPDARVLFDGRPVESTLSPFVIGGVVPGERHSLEVARDGYRTWKTQLSVADGQTLQLPEVVLVAEQIAAPKAVSLAPRVEQPEAAIEPAPRKAAPRPEPTVERRASPPSAPEPSASSMRSPSSAPRIRSVQAAAPAVAPSVQPRAAAPVVAAPPVVGGDTGMLRVNSRPWAQVHVDGRLVGNTPQMALRLSPGKHTVLLVNPELAMRKTFTVQIKRGSVTTKIIELMK